MRLTRTRRAAVSVVAILTLLVCQAAWASSAPLRSFTAALSGASAGGGCHSLGEPGNPESVAPAPCDSAQAPSDAFKLPGVALAVLPSCTVWPAQAVSRGHSSASLTPLGGAPPPLRLIHCRFLN